MFKKYAKEISQSIFGIVLAVIVLFVLLPLTKIVIINIDDYRIFTVSHYLSKTSLDLDKTFNVQTLEKDITNTINSSKEDKSLLSVVKIEKICIVKKDSIVNNLGIIDGANNLLCGNYKDNKELLDLESLKLILNPKENNYTTKDVSLIKDKSEYYYFKKDFNVNDFIDSIISTFAIFIVIFLTWLYGHLYDIYIKSKTKGEKDFGK